MTRRVVTKVSNIPSVEPRPDITNGDILVGSDGSVYINSEYNKAVCIAVGKTRHYLGEEFDSEDYEELRENIGDFAINPLGLSVTIEVQ